MASRLGGSPVQREQEWLARAQEGGEVALERGPDGAKLYNAKRNFAGVAVGWIKDQIGDEDRKQRRADAKTEFQAFLSTRFGDELGDRLFQQHVDPHTPLQARAVAVAIAHGQREGAPDVEGPPG